LDAQGKPFVTFGKCQGPRDEEDTVLESLAGIGRVDPVVGAALSDVTRRIEDAVGVRRLTDVGRRGKGEIGVAAELPEKVELVVDAAVAAVGPSVGQGPVAVDERPPRSTSRSGQE